MTREGYEALSAPFRTPGRTRAVDWVNKGLTGFCYAAYPILLLVLALGRDGRFWKALLVPGVAFVVLSVVRDRINAPRPYEVLDIQPLIHKETRGHSMPSRHVFCMFLIAVTFLWSFPPMGVLLAVFGVILAATRVVAGVHFPRDVVVGALCGIVAGVLGFWVIP